MCGAGCENWVIHKYSSNNFLGRRKQLAGTPPNKRGQDVAHGVGESDGIIIDAGRTLGWLGPWACKLSRGRACQSVQGCGETRGRCVCVFARVCVRVYICAPALWIIIDGLRALDVIPNRS